MTAPGERQEWVCKTTFSRRTQRPLADFAEPPQSKRRNPLRRKSGVFCARSVRTAVRSRRRCPADTFGTTFCHQKVAPKVSAMRKAAGNSQRLAKTGACRGLRHEVSFRLWRLGKVNFALTCRSSFASKPAPFFNACRCSFLFPHFSQCGTIVRFAQP